MVVTVVLARRDKVPVLPPGQAVYIFDDAVKIGQDGQIFSRVPLADYTTTNPVWNGGVIVLAGARAETVAFQVVVHAGEQALDRVDVQISDLAGSSGAILPSSRAVRFRQFYTEVTRPSRSPAGSTGPGRYPDALIPADLPDHGLPVGIARHQVQGVWIDLEITPDTVPGIYRGSVTVRSDEQLLARHELELEVYDFVLPGERHLRFRSGYGDFGEYLNDHEQIGYSRVCGKESAEFRAREADLYQVAWAHRLAPTTHYSPPIPEHSGSGAALTIDWTTFDRRFAAYLDGSAFADQVPINSIALPVNLYSRGGWPSGIRPETARTPADVDGEAITTAVAQTVQHWRERGWPIVNSFVYLADEPQPDRYEILDAACRAIRHGDRDVPVTIPFYRQFGNHAAEIIDRFQGCVNMWDIAGDYMNLPALQERQAAGDTVGFYQGSEPYQGSEALDADGLAFITWPWIAWRYRLDTLFLYNMTEWTYFRVGKSNKPWRDLPHDIWINPLNQSWQTNSQGVLLYPGDRIGYPGVIASIRLKQIRRGMQDYEYLWLLAQKGDRARADAIARHLVPRALYEAAPGFGDAYNGPGAWQRDPREWARARRDLAAAITR